MRFVLLTTLAILAAIPAFAEAPTVKADKSFTGIGIDIHPHSTSKTGTIEIYAAPRQVGDKLAICGLVYVDSKSSTVKTLEKHFTSQVQFSLGGKNLQVITAFFKRYYAEADLASALAGCSVTQTPWDASFAKAAFTMQISNARVLD